MTMQRAATSPIVAISSQQILSYSGAIDQAQAQSCHRASALRSHAPARNALGDVYHHGHGVLPDRTEYRLCSASERADLVSDPIEECSRHLRRCSVSYRPPNAPTVHPVIAGHDNCR
jgi:hypothetical protein